MWMEGGREEEGGIRVAVEDWTGLGRGWEGIRRPRILLFPPPFFPFPFLFFPLALISPLTFGLSIRQNWACSVNIASGRTWAMIVSVRSKKRGKDKRYLPPGKISTTVSQLPNFFFFFPGVAKKTVSSFRPIPLPPSPPVPPS